MQARLISPGVWEYRGVRIEIEHPKGITHSVLRFRFGIEPFGKGWGSVSLALRLAKARIDKALDKGDRNA